MEERECLQMEDERTREAQERDRMQGEDVCVHSVRIHRPRDMLDCQ